MILGAGKHQTGLVTTGAIMGGHVRVGLEDNLYLEKGVHAKSNAEQVACYMPERRFALLATLLSPSGDFSAGDFIPDDAVCRGVWPRNRQKGREHVNVLLKRAREDLVKAGLNGFKLLDRAQGGGATRFVVPTAVTVTVHL